MDGVRATAHGIHIGRMGLEDLIAGGIVQAIHKVLATFTHKVYSLVFTMHCLTEVLPMVGKWSVPLTLLIIDIGHVVSGVVV